MAAIASAPISALQIPANTTRSAKTYPTSTIPAHAQPDTTGETANTSTPVSCLFAKMERHAGTHRLQHMIAFVIQVISEINASS